MTRFLSHALQAPEPLFGVGLRRLEAANGNPSTDIRVSTHVQQATKAKLRELGLDPADTTPEELYHALQERIKTDDTLLTKRLRTAAATHISAEVDVIAGMIHVLKQLPDSTACFALKNSKLKSMLKKIPPKKAMKQLGYRSLDSFLKHEPPILVLAAAWLTEGTSWRRRLLDQYKQLKAADFESRSISLMQPDARRWHTLAAAVVGREKHNLICLKELGAIVFLPLPTHTPPGAVTVSLSLALHELNQIRAGSTFLKLCQFRPDFGSVVGTVALEEPQLQAELLDQPVSWSLVQRYYVRLAGRFREEIFEPHIQLEDMAWQPIEQILSSIEPRLKFWQDSAHLALLHHHRPVSCNIVDAALNYCNQLPFERRVAHYFQQSLWHELLLQYLRHDTVEQTVLSALQPQLVAEAVPA